MCRYCSSTLGVYSSLDLRGSFFWKGLCTWNPLGSGTLLMERRGGIVSAASSTKEGRARGTAREVTEHEPHMADVINTKALTF